ncbi:hypothetical protein RQP46_004950 [Phenoliferia psychrophenolica]
MCPDGQSLCPVGDGHSLSCINTRTNPMQCGGCTLENRGMICSSLEGVDGSACEGGECIAKVLRLIFDLLPLHSDVVRPRSALLPLVGVSRSLRDLATQELNSAVYLRTLADARAFIRVDDERVGASVTTLALHRLGKHAGQAVRTLLSAPTRRSLRELRINAGGVDSVQALVTTLLQASASGSPSSGLGAALMVLSLDLAHPPTASDEQPGIDNPASQGTDADDLGGQTGSTLSLLDVCLVAFPRLSSLSVRLPHLPITFAASLASTACPLRHLELKSITISDETLLGVFSALHQSLTSLAIVDTDGYTASGCGAAIAQIEYLRNLKIEVSVQQAPFANPHPYSTLLDILIPHTPHLVRLTVSGPVCSGSFAALLRTCTPSLQSLTLSPHSPLGPSSLLPVVVSDRLHLRGLRRLRVDIVPSAAEEAADARELWGVATTKGIDISGNAFENVNWMVGWALEVGAKELEREAPKRPRRRPGVARS